MRILRRPRALASPLAALALALSGGCGEDAGKSVTDTDTGDVSSSLPPTAEILSPAADTMIGPGEPVTLTGRVSDERDAPPSLEVVWRSSLLTGELGRSTPTSSGDVALELPQLVVGTHVITLEVTDSGGSVGTDTLTLVVNGAPSAPGVTLTPATPTTLDDLVANVTPATDPNRASDRLTYRYAWFKDGTPTTFTNDTLPNAATTRGETWTVKVAATDGALEGPLGEATVTIANAAPSCDGATLFPTAGTAASTFNCACAGFDDPDGDADASTCTFYDGDAILGEPNGPCTLESGTVTRGMNLSCSVTPDDGQDAGAGTPVTTAAASVLNAKPTAPGAGLSPAAGTVADTYTCATTTPSTDADGDNLTYQVSWLVNGYEDPDAHLGTVTATSLRRDAAGAKARRGDRLRCRLRASDGADTSSPGDSPELTFGNAAPDLDNVLVQPESGTRADASSTLICNTSGATDPDGDTLTTVYVWLVDGEPLPGETGRTLSGGFARGDKVTCQASVTDGETSSTPATSKNTLVIANAMPTLADVSTSPESASAGGDVTCVYTGWSDADGDAPEVAISWYVDGVELPGEEGATLSTDTLAPGVEVTCVVTPKNGDELGEPVPSGDGTVIVNSPPTLTGVSLTPASPKADATLTCTPEGFADLDGDAPAYAYAWTNNGAPIEGATTQNLSGAFDKGDVLRCQVTPGDGHVWGEPTLSGAVTIQNSVPTLGAARVSPAGGSPCAVYSCLVEGGADADAGDVVSYGYRWLKNGAEVSGETRASFEGELADGDTLACAARPTDGTMADGALVYGAERVSAAVAIVDTPPVIGAVAITPEAPGVGALLTCSITDATDDCAETLTYTYQWTVDGAVVEATGATFDTSELDLADEVRCQATPHDGQSEGTPKASPVVALGPGQPTAPVVEVQAPDGIAGAITCAITKPARWFVNPTTTYYWSINGAAEFVDGATLTAAKNDCDLLACRAVVSDASATRSSEPASLQLAVGDGCEDGNDCSSHFCRPEGGCGVTLEDGIFCDNGDPCAPTGVCDQGACVASGNICFEEPVNLDHTTASNSPVLTADTAAFADGRYVSTWAGTTIAKTAVRMTASDDSRRDEEVILSSGGTTNDGGAAAVSPDQSEVLIVEIGNPTRVVAHRRSADDLAVALAPSTVAFNDPGIPYTSCYSGTRATNTTQAFPLYLGGVAMVAHTYVSQSFNASCSGGGTVGPQRQDVLLTAVAGDYQLANYELVDALERDLANVDVVALRTGVLAAFVVSGSKSIKARVKDFAAGAVSTRFTVDVDTGTVNINRVRAAALPDGGFVVAWAKPNGTQGADVFYRRYDEDGVAAGPAVLVNSRVAGDQVLDDIAAFSDGGVVVAYTDPTQAQGNDVMARLFSAADVAEGDAFPLALYSTAAAQYGASLAVFADDGWAATWIDTAMTDAAGKHLRFMTRRFFRDGDPDPGVRARPVPAYTAGDQTNPAAAATPDDVIMVAFEAPVYTGLGTEIQRRLFDKTGKPKDLDATVNTTIDGVQKAPAVAASANRFVVAWESVGQDGDSSGIYLQRFDKTGLALGDETRVNTTTAGAQTGPVLASRPDGLTLVAWTGKETAGATTDVFGKVFDAEGNVLMAETVLNKVTTGNQAQPALTVTKDGHFVIAWQSNGEVDGLDVFMRKLSVGGTASARTFTLGTAAFRANETTAGDQGAPSLSISKGTTPYLAACWESLGAGTDGKDVLCQIFNDAPGGFPVARTEFSPVAARAGTQARPKVTHVSTGQLVVAWETGAVDFSGTAVHFTRLPAAGPAVLLPRYVANRYPYGDQARPVLSPLATEAGRLLVVWQSAGEDGSGQGIMMRAP